MGLEIEYKLRARDEQELGRVYEDLRSRFAVGGERVLRMHTRYFDTPDRLLREKRWTLRIRQENDKQVLTCKTPGKGRSRGEWSLVRTDPAPTPRSAELEALAALGAPEALCGLTGLTAICGARFTRRCVMLELPEARIEIAAESSTARRAGSRCVSWSWSSTAAALPRSPPWPPARVCRRSP